MTVPPTFPDPTPTDDELVSAVLDGEAPAEAAARVAADPRLAARLDALREVASAVAATVPVDADAARRHLARAREEWASTGPADRVERVETAGAAVVDLAARRRPRQARLVGVAAAVLALALLVPVLVAVMDRSDGALDESATGVPTSSTATETGAAAAEGTADAGASAPVSTTPSSGEGGSSAPSSSTGEPADLGDLGAAPDAVGLRARVDAALAGRSDPAAGTAGPADLAGPTPDPAGEPVPDDPLPDDPVATASSACAGPVASATGVPSVRARAEASVGDLAVAVYVIDGADGAEVVVVDPATCSVVARLPL